MSLKELFNVIWKKYITKNNRSIERLEDMIKLRECSDCSEFMNPKEREILVYLIKNRFPHKESGVLEIICLILEMTNLLNDVYGCFSHVLYACDLQKVKKFCLVSRIMNHFLCSYETRSAFELMKMLEFLSLFLKHVRTLDLDVSKRSRNLVPVYLGIQFVLSKLLDDNETYLGSGEAFYNAKTLCCQCFELLLETLRPSMKFFQTNLYYNPKKSFMKFSISFRNEMIYMTTRDSSAKIYFSLLDSIVRKLEGVGTGHVRFPGTLEFAEGNLLSIFTSIDRKTLRYIFKFDFFVDCLCRIALNRSSFFHMYMALKNIYRIFEMDEFFLDSEEKRKYSDDESRILDWKRRIEGYFGNRNIDIHECIEIVNSMESPNNVSFLGLSYILDEHYAYRKKIFGRCKVGRKWVKSVVRVVTITY